ncbi:MAG: hypothetical protein H0V44_08770 [Planctomycetes bacterium]|nr:hypothetical protein [Planctomycetota bacterium]
MTTATTTDRYVIRTASGDKGPFTRAQIAQFVAAGKLSASAKILDVDAQRAVSAGEVVASASGPAPVLTEADASDPTPDAGMRIDPNSVTPSAPGTRIPGTTSRVTKGAAKTGTARRTRGNTEAATGKRTKRRAKGRPVVLIAVLAIVAVGLVIGAVIVLGRMRTDHSPQLVATLQADALAHPETLVTSGPAADPAYLRVLAQRFHAQALADAKVERGSLSQYKPGYDAARYRGSLAAAIGKQLATPDATVVDACARDLVTREKATPAEIAAGKALAQQAVTLDGEKNHRSLITLAWATFRSGDAKRAGLIAEQAMEIAPDAAAKSECGDAIGAFRTGNAER